MKRVLITGINGFVGSHLAEYILSNNFGEIYGLIRNKDVEKENISSILNKIHMKECDINDAYSVKQVIEDVEPDILFHLAAQSYVPSSWSSPVETMQTNVIGSMNIFEAVRNSKLDTIIQIAGSSEEYGMVYEKEVPITEDNPLRPLSPYGVSKVAMDLLGYQYHQSYGLKIIRTRAFNHTGPRRGEVFVTSNWAKQIAMIEAKKQEPIIRVGALDPIRDFTDVRDMVRAYWLATQKGKFGEVYNICSGKGILMKDLLNLLLSLSKIKPKIEKDPARMRPSDVKILLGSCKKFNKETGWKAEIPFEKTMEDLLNYWREKI